MRMKLEIVDVANSSYQAVLMQPSRKRPARFAITAHGISDQK
jgi:hypothetical protein